MPDAPAKPLAALVLAGERASGDPLAREAGVAHKSLLVVRGLPMLVRVVQSLAGSAGVERVLVSAGSPALLEAHPALVALRQAGVLAHRPAAASPATSVRETLAEEGGSGPLLVTTSDHPLLTSAMVDHFRAEAERSGAEVAAAVVAREVFRARFPEAPRTFIPLRGEAVTGANLFWFRSSRGAPVADFWRRTETVRKSPWRLASLFGAANLARFALRRMTLEDATRRISRRVGVAVAAVRLPYPECGLDVDRPGDVALAERALAEAGGWSG